MIGRGDMVERQRRSWLSRRWPGALLVGALIALTVAGAVPSAILRRQQIEDRRRETAVIAAETLSATTERLFTGLGGAGVVVGPRGRLDLPAFASFGRGLVVQPGVSAIALEGIVEHEDRADFERRHGFPIADRVGAGEYAAASRRDRYFPIVAVSPSTELTRSLLGLDIGNDPARAPVATASLDAGAPRMSPPLELSTTGDPGVVIVAPLYRNGAPLQTVDQRREAAVGFVSSAYSSRDLVAMVEQRLPEGTRLTIFDGSSVVSGDPDDAEDAETRDVSVGGRRWTVGVVVPGDANLAGSLWLLLAGLALAGMVQLAISLARRRETMLEESRHRLRAEARRNETMQMLSSALLEAEDAEEVLGALVRCSREQVGADLVVLGLLSDDGSTVEIRPAKEGVGTGSGARTDTLEGRLPIDADDPLVEVTLAGVPGFSETAEGPKAVLPLRAGRQTLGALQLAFPASRSLDADDRALLEDLASAGARALEQARLFAAVDDARAQAERERNRVESQRRLSVELSRAGTAEAAADIVLRRVIAISASVAGGVALAHEDGYLEFVSVRGMAGDDAARMPRLAIDDAAASSEAFRTGREVLAATAEEFRQRFPDGYRISGRRGRGVWALPLVAQGSPIGAVVLVLNEDRLPTADDQAAIRALAAQVAQALRRARASDQTREAAEHLQRAMLPVELPSPAGASVDGLYRSAAQILEVGGDWFDAVEVVDGVLAMAVGDVVGRGLSAAATMGQLRVAWRALSQEASGPAALLTALDRFSRALPGAEVSTVASAELELSSGVLRYACAGHLPPLVLDRSGHARFLEHGRSVPLAVMERGGRDEASIVLEAGDTVVLYTDGLVERRDESLDDGLERMRKAAEEVRAPRNELGGELAALLIDEGGSVDDVAILTVTVLPSFQRIVVRDPRELAPVRTELRAWLRAIGVPGEIAEDVVLASGEALANAIEHAHPEPGGAIDLRAWTDGATVTLRVVDDGAWSPAESDPSRGNGLAIMRALMDQVIIDTDSGGTRVQLARSLPRPPVATQSGAPA